MTRPRSDQQCYVTGVQYPNMAGALKACLLAGGVREWVSWREDGERKEARARALWPDQDWKEVVAERWCKKCEGWLPFDQLHTRKETFKKRDDRWFVMCEEGHELLRTKKRINWVVALLTRGEKEESENSPIYIGGS